MKRKFQKNWMLLTYFDLMFSCKNFCAWFWKNKKWINGIFIFTCLNAKSSTSLTALYVCVLQSLRDWKNKVYLDVLKQLFNDEVFYKHAAFLQIIFIYRRFPWQYTKGSYNSCNLQSDIFVYFIRSKVCMIKFFYILSLKVGFI